MKKILLSLLLAFLLVAPVPIQALEKTTRRFEYLGNGLYYEEIITEMPTSRASNSKKGTKTTKCISANGVVLWQVSVTGTFTYNKKTSTCTSSYVDTKVYASAWKITSKKSSKNKNTAHAVATAKLYFGNSVLKTKTKTVKLSCNKTGVLS